MKSYNNSGVRIFILLILIGILSFSVYAQNFQLDSLLIQLKNARNPDSNKVKILIQLGKASIPNRITDVLTYSDEAIEISNKVHYLKGEAESNRLLGQLNLIENPGATAIPYLVKALKIFKQLKDRCNEGYTLLEIARYYIIQQDFVEAESYINEAEPFFRANLSKEGETEFILAKGEVSLNKKDFENTNYLLTQLSGLPKSQKNPDLTNRIQYLQARLFLAEKKSNSGIELLDKSLLFYESTNNILGQYNIQEILGCAYLSEKQADKARIYFDACIQLAHQYGSINLLSKTFKNLSRLDSLKGDSKLSFSHYSQFMRLKDSLTRSENDRQAALFEARFSNERKSKENQNLIFESLKNKSLIRQECYVLIFLLLVLMGLIILLVKLQQLNSKNKFALEEVLVKNEEIVFKNKIIEEQRLRQEKINLVKDKLFSVISHDMRTPLTQLQGILGLMEANAMKMSEWTELLPSLKRNVQTSTEQLDTLLIWSKNQMQGFQPHISQFSIHRLAEKNFHLLKVSLEEKSIEFQNSLNPELMLEADLEMIQIVLRNLLTNAIKFTRNKGKIVLYNEESSTHAKICVKDTGVGIKKEDFEKIFEEIDFSTPGTLGEKGTGLGLKLCRDFVVMNGGDIYVESTENEGSTFIFSVPLALEKIFRFSQEVK